MNDFIWPLRVYYEDSDAGGVVYYANYLKFMERARTEWLREKGFNQIALKQQHNSIIVVRKISIDYLKPAFFDDLLTITVHISKIGKASIIKLWQIVPKYSENENESQDNKFQSLQGRNSILVKLEQMIKESKENILVLGTETDFKKFYFTEFSEFLNKTKSDLKILVDE